MAIRRKIVLGALVLAVCELAVFFVVAHFLGFGWVFALLFGLIIVGFITALPRLRRVLRHPRSSIPQAPALVLGTFATLIPGILSSLIGFWMLSPFGRTTSSLFMLTQSQRLLARFIPGYEPKPTPEPRVIILEEEPRSGSNE